MRNSLDQAYKDLQELINTKKFDRRQSGNFVRVLPNADGVPGGETATGAVQPAPGLPPDQGLPL